MNDLRTAAQQALEALEHDGLLKKRQAITALRDALAEQRLTEAQQAEPVREPVAWVEERAISWLASRRNKAIAHITTGLSAAKTIERTVPLYTAPPKLVPLTDEEILKIGQSFSLGFTDKELARAIERALEKKNGR